jgi:hypothetical protein
MRRLLSINRWIVAGAGLLALGGCYTSQQLTDFTRTEFARTVADVFGRLFQFYVQATS